MVTARDITEQKRTEARSRPFYETELFAILYWKIDGGVVDANDQFLKMTGYTREDCAPGVSTGHRLRRRNTMILTRMPAGRSGKQAFISPMKRSSSVGMDCGWRAVFGCGVPR